MSEISNAVPPYHTVLFDMDGTLLDLAFDSYIWMQLVPQLWAEQNHKTLTQAKEKLYQLYLNHQGTLNWYSSLFWQQQLNIDVLALQHEHQQRIAARPYCFELLKHLKAQGVACWLVTNADEKTLQLKLDTIPIAEYFDVMVSSETLGYPKEDQRFWQHLQHQHPFTPEHCTLVDDNYDVLASGKKFGIAHLISIAQPDSKQTRQAQTTDYPHLDRLTDLIPLIFKHHTPIDSTCLT